MRCTLSHIMTVRSHKIKHFFFHYFLAETFDHETVITDDAVRVHLDIGAHISKFINEVNSAFHYGTVAFHMGNNGIIAIANQCLYPFTDIRLLI